MKAKFLRNYTKAETGNKVWVYEVTGTEEELQQYEEAQGSYFRPDTETGAPLYFTSDYVGEVVDMIITEKGKVVADMTELDKAHSLAKRYGGNIGESLANMFVAQYGGKAPAASKAKAAEEEEEGDE